MNIEEHGEEFFRKVIDALFHRHNAGRESKYVRDLLIETIGPTTLDNVDDYLRDWLRQIENNIPRESTNPICLDYKFNSKNTLLVTPSSLAFDKDINDPIQETLNLLEGLVKSAVNDGTYVDPKLKKFFNV